MSTPVLNDDDARRAIREDLDATLFVEAAAGTGKTTALVGRMLELIRSGHTTLDRMVAVTFTEKAAGEMKLRLREEIERERTQHGLDDQARARFDQALEHLELAHISTIHGFCSDLLRERPIEARVDPRFGVIAEDEALALLDQVVEDWLRERLDDPPEGLRRALRKKPPRNATKKTMLRKAAWDLVEHRDFETSWRREPFDRASRIDTVFRALQRAAAHYPRAERKDDWLTKNLKQLYDFVSEIELQERVRDRDLDELEAQLHRLTYYGWHWRGSQYQMFDGVDRQQVLDERDEAKAILDEFLRAADADLAALLRDELREVVERYERRKDLEGRLDFLDLMLRARDLVRDHDEVRADLHERFTHFFVDEFQDTDPLQAEILLLLTADDVDETRAENARPVPGKLFLVGDPKQSIYRFRRADVALYERIKARLETFGARVVHLSASFRAVPAIQQAVNAAFEPAMQGDPVKAQAHYVPLHAVRTDHSGQPAVVALPIPHPYADYGKVTKKAIAESTPSAVAAFVAWLITSSGFTVEERHDGKSVRVPVKAHHVCLLFRRFWTFGQDVTRPYVEALQARRIPHVLIGGASLHEREEVLALRTALAAVEWPDDTLSVYATLHGPFFALSDAQIFAFQARAGTIHPLAPPPEIELTQEEREVRDALDVLRELHGGRNRRPIAETVRRFLHAVRAHAGIAIWDSGEQALANVQRIVDAARRFERRGASSYRAFCEKLEQDAREGRGQESPVVEEGTEGVRIMTAHKAKGLEFGVVILADTTCKASRDEPSHTVDHERRLWAQPLLGCIPQDLLDQRELELGRDAAEAVRTAYVAATRARDMLVVPAVGDGPDDGWVDVLDPALYPPKSQWKAARDAPGCPRLGDDTVLYRPPAKYGRKPEGIAPGLHTAEAGTDVVWFDPKALQLDVPEAFGLRDFHLLQVDRETKLDERSQVEYARWRHDRERMLEAGARPSMELTTATEHAERPDDFPDQRTIEILETQRDLVERPSGVRFGSLVHAVLERVPLDADRERIRALTEVQALLHQAPDEERDACVQAVASALAHDVFDRARAAQALRRETPLFLVHGDELVEGIVDLAFLEKDDDGEPVWTVVDYKTDFALRAQREVYEHQVSLYVQAIENATATRARGVLLVV